MPSFAVIREPEQDAGQEEGDLAGAADDAFAALADAARLIKALAAAGPGQNPLLAAVAMRLAQGTQAAEEVRDALRSRQIRVRAIAEAAVAADRASRCLRSVDR